MGSHALQISSTYIPETTSDADVKELDLFPEYLRGAIRRNYIDGRQAAALSMNFPSNFIADVDCIMTMEVYPNKVERLALLTFWRAFGDKRRGARTCYTRRFKGDG